MQLIDKLYAAQNLDLGEIQVHHAININMLHLRSILDNIVEKLPPLLELGDVPQQTTGSTLNFPYHRPSVMSVATVDSAQMPESLGFVLLQVILTLY